MKVKSNETSYLGICKVTDHGSDIGEGFGWAWYQKAAVVDVVFRSLLKNRPKLLIHEYDIGKDLRRTLKD